MRKKGREGEPETEREREREKGGGGGARFGLFSIFFVSRKQLY